MVSTRCTVYWHSSMFFFPCLFLYSLLLSNGGLMDATFILTSSLVPGLNSLSLVEQMLIVVWIPPVSFHLNSDKRNPWTWVAPAIGSAWAIGGSDLGLGKLLAARHRSPVAPSPATKTLPHKPKPVFYHLLCDTPQYLIRISFVATDVYCLISFFFALLRRSWLYLLCNLPQSSQREQ